LAVATVRAALATAFSASPVGIGHKMQMEKAGVRLGQRERGRPWASEIDRAATAGEISILIAAGSAVGQSRGADPP
jgi:hypothetical protein